MMSRPRDHPSLGRLEDSYQLWWKFDRASGRKKGQRGGKSSKNRRPPTQEIYARDAWRSTKKHVPLCVEIRRRRFTQSDSILSPELLPNCQSKHADGKV